MTKAIVVGTGFGCRVHVPALRAAGFEVLGLVGTRPEKLQRKADALGLVAFTDLDRAIAATGANLVSIASTPASHGSLALQAIACGCHVLCEKPFAADADEATRLVHAASAANIVHMVAHEFRWQPERALFGRIIAQGLIGAPRFLTLNQFLPICADPEARLPAWWFDKDAGGGWLGASGSHLIDQVRAWFGEFGSISANLFTVSDRQDGAEDSFSARFTMASGIEGSMQQSAGAWGAPTATWRCAGSKGSAWIERGIVHLADASGTREVPMPSDLQLPPADANPPPYATYPEFRPFVRLCEALRAAIEGTQPPSPVACATFEDGLATMRVMDAMKASAAQGGVLVTI